MLTVRSSAPSFWGLGTELWVEAQPAVSPADGDLLGRALLWHHRRAEQELLGAHSSHPALGVPGAAALLLTAWSLSATRGCCNFSESRIQ